MSRGVPRGMDGKQRVPSGYLALFASLYALQGVVVAYFFNFNQLYMMAGGVSKADAADERRVLRSGRLSSSSWAVPCPTGSTCWDSGTASPTS